MSCFPVPPPPTSPLNPQIKLPTPSDLTLLTLGKSRWERGRGSQQQAHPSCLKSGRTVAPSVPQRTRKEGCDNEHQSRDSLPTVLGATGHGVPWVSHETMPFRRHRDVAGPAFVREFLVKASVYSPLVEGVKLQGRVEANQYWMK